VKSNPGLPCQSSIQQKESSFHQQTGLTFKDNVIKCYNYSIALYGTETWALWKINEKYLESLKCWRGMENISYSEGVKYEDVLYTVKKKRNIMYKIKERKASWVGHSLCGNCLLKHVIKKKKKTF